MRPAAPHRALWQGPWGTLLLIGNARVLVAARFQGGCPAGDTASPPDPLPAPWGLHPTLRLALTGTDFQLAVWRSLTRIASGECVSYSELAAAVDRPRAVRAVASAVAANPLPVVLPCHRVIRRDGGHGGYIGGASRKRRLIHWETNHGSHPRCS
ncbi:methylated-DNA--[protein]-cysteine S-methyltransferase [Spiribacter insolitus]|uniref:Methylated-DNA--[protein]-cysteine S-methyltransferase n=1 Tax=Spiribacter insolitus TaxID=3122417 RepID=A0ABV3T9N1_9GAMM